MRQSRSPLDQINRLVILGLLSINIILWIGIFFVFAITGKTDSSMILAASSISSGLLGFLSREFKTISGDDNSATVTGPIDTVDQPKKDDKTQ